MRTEIPTYEPDTRREDDDARQQRWEEFLAEVRRLSDYYGDGFLLLVLADLVEDEFHGIDAADAAAADLMRNFAETEGWSGVLSAVAQAMRERERFHRECFDRR